MLSVIGTFAQSQDGLHHLAGTPVRAVVDRAQRPVDHAPGDLVDRDSPIRPLLLSTLETVCLPTPAARATSRLVTWCTVAGLA